MNSLAVTPAENSVRQTPTVPFSVDAIRADFPTLAQQINGAPLVYLDNGATSQKPRAVLETLQHYYELDNANVHRGVHALSERATASYEAARDTVRQFLGAADRREIILGSGTTDSINLVAQCYARPMLSEGDEIIVTTMEHHSNIVPWQMVCEQTGAILKVVPISDAGELELEQFHALLCARTKLVAVTHVSNALGTINPVRELIEAAHAHGAVVLIDGAQAAPHLTIDVQALDCDFYAFSGHKVFGPTGAGALYGKLALLDVMTPNKGGGDMIRSVTFEKTTYNELPYRYEAGTPNIAGVIGLGAALNYVMALDMDSARAHEDAVLAHATSALKSIPQVRIIGEAQSKTGVLSFVIDGAHAHDVGTIIDSEGVAVRTGHHCAMPLMKRYGLAATTRASFAMYNTIADAEALAASLDKVKTVFKL